MVAPMAGCGGVCDWREDDFLSRQPTVSSPGLKRLDSAAYHSLSFSSKVTSELNITYTPPVHIYDVMARQRPFPVW
jgi:hypothetical protein